MAISLKHAFTSNVADSGNAALVQPSNWNAEHTLSAAANTIIGAVTAGPVTEITCTSAGRDLLDDADTAAQRTTLGLAIGTNVQAWDADLDAIAAISGTSGLLRKTAANTWSLDTNSYLTTVSLTSNVTGTLPIANGGTNATTANGALTNLVGYQTIATAAGTTTLTVSSPSVTVFTGSTTQTVQLPDAATLQLGQTFTIVNNSTGTLTVQTFAGAASFTTLTGGLTARYICVSTSGNTLASWVNTFEGATTRTGTGSLVFGTGPTVSGLTVNATQNALTAGTNAQGQGAIGSTSDVVVVTTTAANPSGVTLSASTQGRRVTIVNRGTNPINVYPPASSQIDALGLNNPLSIAVNGVVEFNCVSSTLWYTNIFQQASATSLVGTIPISSGGTNATTAGLADTNLRGFTTTATAGGTTTLTSSSTLYQLFTGTSNQTVALPDVTTLALGWSFHIVNNSTGTLTVNSSGGNAVITIPSGTTAMVTCILTTGTTAASWESGLTDFSTSTGTGSVVLSASPALTGTPTVPSASAYTNTTQAASTAQVYSTVTTVPENAQTGTSYTLVLADAGKLVTLSNASAITLTVPTNASVAFPTNTRIDIAQYGAGQVTVGGAGVTLRSSGSKLKLTGQYSGATLWKKATDEWLLVGDITA